MESKNILVIGMGPAGGICAAHLATAGNRLYGLDVWEDHVSEIARNCLKIENLVTLDARFREVGRSLADLTERKFDYAIAAVKTPNLPGISGLLRELPESCRILVLQNGLDNEYEVADSTGRRVILRMTVNYAGNILAPGRIRMNFFRKPNQVGCICGDTNCTHAHGIADLLTNARLDTESVTDIRRYTWKKAILNAILAPIASLLGVTMADVMANRGTRWLVESLIRESIAVAGAAGYDYGEDFFDQCIDFLLKAGAHKPSMLIDIEKGNPTEIDFINGKIAHFGEKYNIPVPFNNTMTALVKMREQGSSSEKWYMQKDFIRPKESVPATAVS